MIAEDTSWLPPSSGSEGGALAAETTVGALHSLTKLHSNGVAIAKAGGVPALVALFETPVAMLSQDTSSNEAQVSRATSCRRGHSRRPRASAHHGARSPATGLRQLLYSL
jgi:hypothetical protein